MNREATTLMANINSAYNREENRVQYGVCFESGDGCEARPIDLTLGNYRR